MTTDWQSLSSRSHSHSPSQLSYHYFHCPSDTIYIVATAHRRFQIKTRLIRTSYRPATRRWLICKNEAHSGLQLPTDHPHPIGRNYGKGLIRQSPSTDYYHQVLLIKREVQTYVLQFRALSMSNATVNSEFISLESHLTRAPSPLALTVVSSCLLVFGTLYIYRFPNGNNAKKIHQLGGFSIVNAWTFFNKRYDFLRSNFDKTGHNLFSFNVLQVSSSLYNGDFVMTINILAPSRGDVRWRS